MEMGRFRLMGWVAAKYFIFRVGGIGRAIYESLGKFRQVKNGLQVGSCLL